MTRCRSGIDMELETPVFVLKVHTHKYIHRAKPTSHCHEYSHSGTPPTSVSRGAKTLHPLCALFHEHRSLQEPYRVWPFQRTKTRSKVPAFGRHDEADNIMQCDTLSLAQKSTCMRGSSAQNLMCLFRPALRSEQSCLCATME